MNDQPLDPGTLAALRSVLRDAEGQGQEPVDWDRLLQRAFESPTTPLHGGPAPEELVPSNWPDGYDEPHTMLDGPTAANNGANDYDNHDGAASALDVDWHENHDGSGLDPDSHHDGGPHDGGA